MRGSFNPGLLGTGSPVLQARSFNMRQSLTGTAFTGDVAPEIGVTTQTWDGDYGWVNPGTAGANSNRATDRRVYGHWNQNSYTRSFRFAAANGNYGLEFAMGACTVANTRTGVLIADTIDDGLAISGPAPGGILAPGTVTAANKYYVTSDQARIYKCTAGGTCATGNPSGTGSGITDGGAVFDFVGPILFIFDTGASPTIAATEVIDSSGTKRSESAWTTAGGSTPYRLPVILTKGGVTMMVHPNAFGFPRHIGLFPS